MRLVTESKPRPHRDPLLRLPEVEKLVSIKKSTIYALMKRGEFPQCLQVTARTVAWRESSVMDWIASREEGSHGKQADAAAGQTEATEVQP